MMLSNNDEEEPLEVFLLESDGENNDMDLDKTIIEE